MEKIMKYSIIAIAAVLVLAAGMALMTPLSQTGEEKNFETQTITDMAGRNVTVPVQINKVIGTAPPSTMLIYMIAPDKLLAWNSNPYESSKKYIPENYRNLPVAGGWFGKESGNYENFISKNPDIVIEGFTTSKDFISGITERQSMLGAIPVVAVDNSVNAKDYAAAIEFTGKILGEEDKAGELINFYHKYLNLVTERVSEIPEDEKITVYYAEGPQGIFTDPKGSQHSQLIEICGGKNIADCKISPGYGQTEVSIEQIISWNPEVIIAADMNFYSEIYENPLWKEIDAVKNKRVYPVPSTAFSWFDRPPGVNQIIGIPWTAKMLYPEKFEDIDMASAAKNFHEQFYHISLTDAEIAEILNA